MTELSLHNLKINKKSRKKPKRIGRGNASGHGTYSTRGLKGQRARSGGRAGLKRLAMKQLLKSKPKIGGFRSLREKMVTVNVSDLEKYFNAGEIVNPVKLFEMGLTGRSKSGVKILGNGELTKKLNVFAHKFSESAKQAIIKAGGSAQTMR